MMLFAEGLLTKEQVVQDFGIPTNLESDLFSVLRPRVGELYLKRDVEPAIDKVLPARNRPDFANNGSPVDKENTKVNETYLAPEPFERIAQGIERLIDVLVPRMEVSENSAAEMFTPSQAAKKMGLNVQTVREWCRGGRLGVRAGRKWLISPDEVKQYLRGQLLIKGKVAG